MVSSPEDDPHLSAYLADLSVSGSSRVAPPYELPYVAPDAYLSAEMIAAAFQQFTRDASREPAATYFAIAFEHVVQTIRTAYQSALGTAKIAEELGKARIDSMEVLFRERSEHEKMKNRTKKQETAQKHEAELARVEEKYTVEKQTTIEKHTAEKQMIIEKHTAEKQTTFEKHAAEKQTTIEKHAAEITSSKLELELTTKVLKTEVESAKRQTVMLREEMSLARHRYIASNLENGSILQGSVSRCHSWQEAMKHGLRNQTLPILSVHDEITYRDVAALTKKTFPDEPAMYAPTTKLLAKLLDRPRTENDPGVKVFNTHNRTVLPPFKPDLCICLDGSIKAESTSVYVAIELKHISKTIDDDAFGQVLDDLLVMHRCQPARTVLASLLSNLETNYIVLLRIINSREQQVVHYKTVSLAIALTFIKQVLLSESSYRPPVPSFSIFLQSMERRLGNPNNSVVAEFKMPKEIVKKVQSQWPSEHVALGTTMAVKVLLKNIPPARAAPIHERIITDPDHSQELMIYHLIQSFEPCENISKLVYESENGRELGIAPVGNSIDLRGISDHFTLSAILADVLHGITWLHSHGIIHRDIRRDNIIVVSQDVGGSRKLLRGKIIDFGAAISVRPGETEHIDQDYVGGYICCPRELIGDIRRTYTPRPADDLLAWVMLVNFLVFPNGVPFMHSQLVAGPSAEADKLTQYWHRLMASDIWGPFVRAAETEGADQAELLEEMMYDLIVML